MAKKPGQSVRGSTTGRPIMVLLDALGRRWALRVLWELSSGPSSFRDLQARCGDVSPTSLNARLKDLRDLQLVALTEEGYALTRHGRDLAARLGPLNAWANTWAKALG
ncbi:MAG: helix-turn-helix transcriptional regulator [Hyphomonas sp.]|nr:helix-turn-helix transcriptional regulator [Hyphomonas sp.]